MSFIGPGLQLLLRKDRACIAGDFYRPYTPFRAHAPDSVEGSQLSRSDKRLWKRIWWTLFTRDRSVAVALGRPVHINTDDSDVEMVSKEDFLEDELGSHEKYPADPTCPVLSSICEAVRDHGIGPISAVLRCI